MDDIPSDTGNHLGEGSDPSPPRNYLQIGLFCLAVALTVAVGWTLIQRRNEPDDAQAKQLPSEKTAVPVASVRLATEPVELTNEELQNELLVVIETLVSQFPENPQAMHVAASAYDEIHQTSMAAELWQRCIQIDPRHVGPLLGMARLLSEKGEDAKAIELLEQALDDRIESAELYYRLAQAHSKVGEIERAEEVLKEGVAAFPQVAINWLELGQMQNQLQKFQEAEKSLRRSLELDDSSAEAYFALANACQRQEKTEEAARYRQRFSEMKKAATEASKDKPFQEIYQQALRPVVVDSLASAAAVYAAHDDQPKAEQLLLRANELDPGNHRVLQELVRLYRKQEEIADAKLVQQRLVELQPTNAIYQINFANLATLVGDDSAAESALAEARGLWPDHPLPFIGSAQLELQQGKLELARQYAEHAVRLEPSPAAYAVLAAVCQQQGDAAAAEAAQRELLRMAPQGR